MAVEISLEFFFKYAHWCIESTSHKKTGGARAESVPYCLSVVSMKERCHWSVFGNAGAEFLEVMLGWLKWEKTSNFCKGWTAGEPAEGFQCPRLQELSYLWHLQTLLQYRIHLMCLPVAVNGGGCRAQGAAAVVIAGLTIQIYSTQWRCLHSKMSNIWRNFLIKTHMMSRWEAPGAAQPNEAACSHFVPLLQFVPSNQWLSSGLDGTGWDERCLSSLVLSQSGLQLWWGGGDIFRLHR